MFRIQQTFYFCLCLFLLISYGGCYSPQKSTQKFSEAHKKFIKLCKEESGLNIVTKALGNTFWIYLPMEESILTLKASEQDPQKSDEATERLTIKFLDGNFENLTFNFRYDIALSKAYSKDYGYGSAYTEAFQGNQRNILTNISRAFADIEQTANLSDSKNKVPDFFVIVIADIVEGIELKTILCFQDLKRVMQDPSFYEEYTRRFIMNYPIGNKNIRGDKKGKHLDFEEITWPEFLTKQIIFRIEGKYQRSAFPPSEDTKFEILKIVAEALDAYQFSDFEAVGLHDRSNNNEFLIEKSQLEEYRTEKQPSEGKLHILHFK